MGADDMALIRMRRGDGETVLVEVDGPATKAGVGKAGAVSDAAASIILDIDRALDRVLIHEIVENCRTLDAAFTELATRHSRVTEATVEFGLKVSGEGNVYVVKTSVEAAFTVNVKWALGSPTLPPTDEST